jgi:hypothetical protein
MTRKYIPRWLTLSVVAQIALWALASHTRADDLANCLAQKLRPHESKFSHEDVCHTLWGTSDEDRGARATLENCRAKYHGSNSDDAPMVCIGWNKWLADNGMTPMRPIEDANGCYDWRGHHFCRDKSAPAPRVIERKVYVPVPVQPSVQQNNNQQVIVVTPPAVAPAPQHCRSWCDGIGIATHCYQDCN